MTELEAQVIIDGIFDQIEDIPVLHDNETYTGNGDEWMRVCIQYSTARQMSMGDNPLFRYRGICFVQIFVKPNTGSGRALQIADLISPLIRSKQIDGITFFVPSVHKVGESNGWYQVNVLTHFYRED